MANISEFYGSVTFDFTKTNLKPKKISKIMDTICGYFYKEKGEYYTEMYFEDIEKEDLKNGIINIGYDGCGKWSFPNNVEWFVTDKEILNEILPQCCGLAIVFEYCDAEEGGNFIVMNAKIKVKYGINKGTIEQLDDGEVYEYTKENYDNIFLG